MSKILNNYKYNKVSQSDNHPRRISAVRTSNTKNQYEAMSSQSSTQRKKSEYQKEISRIQNEKQIIMQEQENIPIYSVSNDQQDYEKFQSRINTLLKEINSLCTISNQLMEDNNTLKDKLIESRQLNSELKQSNQEEISKIMNNNDNKEKEKLQRQIQILEEKLKKQEQETSMWREKYQTFEQDQDKILQLEKQKLSDSHNIELEQIRKELQKNNKTQKIPGSKREKKQLIDKNDDWLQKYLDLKLEKEKNEKIFQKKISEMEEQNTFLVTENNQFKENPTQQEKQKTQQNANYEDLNDYFQKFIDDHKD